jgi:hypothetical protein
MKAGACERSEVRAGITKVREDFLIRSFMTAHRLVNPHTRGRNNLTDHEFCVSTHCNTIVMVIKKKFLMTLCDTSMM